MAKAANPGELRTPVYVKKIIRQTDDEGYSTEDEVNVFGENIPLMVKWVNAHGRDTFTAMQMELREPATITCRYSARITPDCLIYRKGDDKPYEIISPDNVEERNAWMEITVQRKVNAR